MDKFVCAADYPVVQTEAGKLRGYVWNDTFIFKGIKYADAKRFRRPEKVQPWEGIKDAQSYGMVCPLLEQDKPGMELLVPHMYWPMDENCQYLNIWTQSIDKEAKKPVMVWLHGGGFFAGSSIEQIAYDGENMSREGDVVVVSLNHRLNVLGYLDLSPFGEEYEASANVGSFDMIAALQWVRDNIAAFGGDPDNVTIFGQSAGGMSVQNLCGTPLANGLYQHAIMQSGGGLSKGGPLDEFSLEKAYECSGKYLAYAGIDSPVNARNRDAKELIDLFVEFKGDKGYSGMFQPCVDGYVHPLPMAEYFMKGMQPDIDYMIGCTRDEMRRFGAPAPAYEQIRATAEATYGEKAAQFLEAVHADDPKICARYFEDPIGSNMLSGDLAWCENQLILGRKPAYEYYFTYVPPGAEAMGAHHSVEHHYVFQTLVRSKRPYTGFDFDLSNKLCDYWTNFCKTGNPNGDGEETWAPFTKEHPEALIIDDPCHMGKVAREPQIAFHVDYTLNRL